MIEGVAAATAAAGEREGEATGGRIVGGGFASFSLPSRAV